MSKIPYNEPKYDTDLVNLGYLKKTIGELEKGEDQEEQGGNFNKNFGVTPTPPYHLNDTWMENGKIYKCIRERLTGDFNMSDWELAGTDDTKVDYITDNILSTYELPIPKQIDDKIESFYQETNPSINWDDELEKAKHNGDLWKNKDKTYIYKKQNTNPVTYAWEMVNAISTLFNEITGYKAIYVVKPNSYQVGDFWFVDTLENAPNGVVIGDLMVATKTNTAYEATDWTKNEVEVIKVTANEDIYYDKEEIKEIQGEIEADYTTKIQLNKDSIMSEVSAEYTTKNEIRDLEDNLIANYTTTTELENVITQTIKETTNLISQTGGSNLIKNSQFYQDLPEWEKSSVIDYETITGTTDVEQNTTSKSEFILKNGTVKQNYSTIIGKEYTVAFQYRKQGTPNKESSVKLFNGTSYIDILVKNTQVLDRTFVYYTYKATVNNPQLIISTDLDNFYISDLVIQAGTSTEWSPNATETRGLGHTLTGSNLDIYDVGTSGEKVKIDPNSIEYYQNDELKSYYNKTEMKTYKADIVEEANVCGLNFTKINESEIILS